MEQGLIQIQNDALLGTIVYTKDAVETSMVRTTVRKVGSVSSRRKMMIQLNICMAEGVTSMVE
jgi:hypothetical protein